jgi:hypothetical protein
MIPETHILSPQSSRLIRRAIRMTGDRVAVLVRVDVLRVEMSRVNLQDDGLAVAKLGAKRRCLASATGHIYVTRARLQSIWAVPVMSRRVLLVPGD